MVFFSFLSAPDRDHCPMHGPQALVNIFVPRSSKVLIKPSLSMVYRTSSEPGLIPNSAAGFNPFDTACAAMDAALEISS